MPTKKLNVDHVTAFFAKEGQSYSHQAQLTSHNNRLYATWSLGLRDEEAPGERMVLAISENGGQSWSEPITVAPAVQGQYAPSVIVSAGLRFYGDMLVAYYGAWERYGAERGTPEEARRAALGQEAFNVRTECRISRDGGLTWSEPTLVMPNVANYMPPEPTRTGRLILPGHFTYSHTDDPAGLTGWKRAAIPGIPEDYCDDYLRLSSGAKLLGTKHGYNEANFYQTDDGILHMMLRNETHAYLGVTESRDNGETWSKPMLTGFTNSISRSHFGRLPDGRYFCVNCPVLPVPGATATMTQSHRTPVVLALSKDGIVFDRHYILGDEPELKPRIPGLYKHGRYGYPYMHVANEQAYIIYSRYKEDIYVARFQLSDLD